MDPDVDRGDREGSHSCPCHPQPETQSGGVLFDLDQRDAVASFPLEWLASCYCPFIAGDWGLWEPSDMETHSYSRSQTCKVGAMQMKDLPPPPPHTHIYRGLLTGHLACQSLSRAQKRAPSSPAPFSEELPQAQRGSTTCPENTTSKRQRHQGKPGLIRTQMLNFNQAPVSTVDVVLHERGNHVTDTQGTHHPCVCATGHPHIAAMPGLMLGTRQGRQEKTWPSAMQSSKGAQSLLQTLHKPAPSLYVQFLTRQRCSSQGRFFDRDGRCARTTQSPGSWGAPAFRTPEVALSLGPSTHHMTKPCPLA